MTQTSGKPKMTRPIVPRYKLMLFYDLATHDSEAYYQFVMTEMIPAAHGMGLYIFRAFHTIPGPLTGDQPMRQIEYVAEELEIVESMLESDAWHDLEDRLGEFVTNYSRKVVRFRQGFQL
jgi:hypothetical protein